MDERDFAERVQQDETELLIQLNVAGRLKGLLASPVGLTDFASSFYFVRYGFYRLNFIVGARSGPDELFWGGLAGNLAEELGGFKTASHNALYRDFLSEAGVPTEKGLRQPRFTIRFNRHWEHFCAKAPFPEALAAIAVYEVLDQPDYALLLGLMRGAGVGKRGLVFFEVHAHAKHFDLFEGSMSQLWKSSKGRGALHKAAHFVNSTQGMMWNGLLGHLERRARPLHVSSRSMSTKAALPPEKSKAPL